MPHRRRSRPVRVATVLAAGAVLLAASRAGAQEQEQERQCDLIESGRVEQRETAGVTLLEFQDPFYFRCTDGSELRANRGTWNRASGLIELRGSVFFRDPFRSLTSSEATYEAAVGRLHATGDVVFIDTSEGSEIRGPELEYFRPIEGRPEPQVHARQRPHLTLQPRDADADADTEPLEIDADEVTILGRDDLQASGAVVITRTDLRATGERASYSGASGNLSLLGDAAIESGEYDLTGDRILARTTDGALEHVHATDEAMLSSTELTVEAPDLQLFFADSLLQRAVARSGAQAGGAARPVARSRAFRLEADSIDALVPAQQVDQVIAIGRARGESIDTTAADRPLAAVPGDEPSDTAGAPVRPEPTGARSLVENDWIRGDTIIGYFAAAETAGDSIAPAASDSLLPDTATAPTVAAAAESDEDEVVLERIVSRGSALALYRMAPDSGAPADAPRRVNFLSGQVIELTFVGGELDVARVDGLQRGIFLDPAVGTASAPTAARTDGG